MKPVNDHLLDEAVEFVRKWNGEEWVLKEDAKKLGYRYVRSTSESKKIKNFRENGSYDLMLAAIVSRFKRASKEWNPRTPDEAYDEGYNLSSSIVDLIEAIDMGRARQLFIPGPAYDLKLENLTNEIATLNQQLLNRSTELSNEKRDIYELRAGTRRYE